jgi:hypothetical protein
MFLCLFRIWLYHCFHLVFVIAKFNHTGVFLSNNIKGDYMNRKGKRGVRS